MSKADRKKPWFVNFQQVMTDQLSFLKIICFGERGGEDVSGSELNSAYYGEHKHHIFLTGPQVPGIQTIKNVGPIPVQFINISTSMLQFWSRCWLENKRLKHPEGFNQFTHSACRILAMLFVFSFQEERIALLCCNPAHTFLGINPIGHNGIYIWVDMPKIVLLGCSITQCCGP